MAKRYANLICMIFLSSIRSLVVTQFNANGQRIKSDYLIYHVLINNSRLFLADIYI